MGGRMRLPVSAIGFGDDKVQQRQAVAYSRSPPSSSVQRYQEPGFRGLHDELDPGRPRSDEDHPTAAVINRAMQISPPEASTHWSVQTLAAAARISPARSASACSRPRCTAGSGSAIQPHLRKTSPLSTGAIGVEQDHDTAGRYPNPSDKARLLCVNDKPRFQSLILNSSSRTAIANGFATRFGLDDVEVDTHDDIRPRPCPPLQPWMLLTTGPSSLQASASPPGVPMLTKTDQRNIPHRSGYFL